MKSEYSKIKTFLGVILSLNTPVGFSLVGEWKKGFLLFAVVLAFGWIHSLGGSLGPLPFYATLFLSTSVWALTSFISIRHLLKNKSKIKMWRGLTALLLAFVAVHICREFLYVGEPFRAGNQSMSPAIKIGQHFFVTKLGHPYLRSERVVFQIEGNNFFGYLCGLPGDRIAIQNNKVTLNGETIDCGAGLQRNFGRDIPETTVPEAMVYIVNNGFDSTRAGPFPESAVRGKVSFVFSEVAGGNFLDWFFDVFGTFQRFFKPF
jgi:signal peptidase I